MYLKMCLTEEELDTLEKAQTICENYYCSAPLNSDHDEVVGKQALDTSKSIGDFLAAYENDDET